MFERKILTGLLKALRDGSVSMYSLQKDLHVTRKVLEEFLGKMVKNELVSQKDCMIYASLSQKIKLAARAVEAGADLEHVSRALSWLEFEEMAAKVFEENGFATRLRFRFKAEDKFWEIDVLAYRRPLIACAECKHWLRGLGESSILKIIETHVEKTKVFSENLESLSGRIGLKGWDRGVVLPMAITLTSPLGGVYEGVPAVSITELPSFLSDVEVHLGGLVNFKVSLPPSKRVYAQTTLRKR
ncbi:hypothetical protein KEJ21_04965 [Candidatus Bathyarchaeota archaeon]|nr:hypothetical protein [Candidatus Bathyarchaeota archaeon]MBS7631597.1 hypothetical protein [Candidatus Bathyarchaeota archaeon]